MHVTVATLNEEFVGEFSKFGEDPGDMYWPTSCALDSESNLYIADEYLNRITMYDADGEYLRHWGEAGSGPGQFNGPSGIAIAGDTMWLVDSKNNRVQSYGVDGTFKSQFGESGSGKGQFNLPWGICLDKNGLIYVADWRNDRIQQFNQDGEWQASFGTSGDAPGQFKRPNAVSVDNDGDIYVCDRENDRVQILAPDGRFRAQLRGDHQISGMGQDQVELQPGYDSPADHGHHQRWRFVREGVFEPVRRAGERLRSDCHSGPHPWPDPSLSKGEGARTAVKHYR